jgi:hypothetical protein
MGRALTGGRPDLFGGRGAEAGGGATVRGTGRARGVRVRLGWVGYIYACVLSRGGCKQVTAFTSLFFNTFFHYQYIGNPA